ncbi:dynamin family protein [Aetokthonos hydrillicola Thurmond2011]|uniref:Dynamin family protein n=1 Tax=Aetokthonos hydrillicola Thurmond2011 TaxID=2712845 RepID=A0AAP5M5X1_9CYAN|nr:dynamin family protein [Aetokthonos hydrillicola]MBO3459355.1 proteasome protein [Aetokthonos hydrillicola CCALA 1050]MDR9893555.1 dynamin family protein [Aetokthonos hydrillicola Thurmond2011]
MLDVLAKLALQLAPIVLKEIVPILGNKLREQLLAPTPDDTTPRVQIKDEEIIEKIKEILDKRDELIKNDINELIKNDIKGNNGKIEDLIQKVMEELIQKVLNEIKTLSKGTPNLKVEDNEIGLSEPIQEKDQQLNSQELEVRLKEITEKILTSLDTQIAQRLKEIQTPQPLQVTPEHGTKPERAVSSNSPSQTSLETKKNITEQAKSEPLRSEEQSNEDEKQSLAPRRNIEVPENPESQIMLKKLERYKEYGEAVLREINLLTQNQSSPNEVLDNRELQECLKNLKDAANQTVELASSSVKIAIMGEFSSGKTLLVGSLIGYADALPHDELPTTGNVTAIHLVQQEGFKTTEFDNFTVEYLSHEEVKECVDFMLNEARKRAQASELPPFSEVNSTTLNEETLNFYEKWCESAWNQTQNPELRYLLQELVIFIRACASYGASLCGESLTITHTTAREGLKLTNISPLKFEDIPPVAKLSVNKNQPSPELLQNSFSLIRRVNIYVKISKEIWNLGTTQDAAKFIILDFPGLGAAKSGVRDTFVSLQELEKVQTILILLNGTTVGGDRANKIVNMIRQKRPKQNLNDFILVGVGRFNELPIEEQKLNQLIDNSANNPLTEKSIYQELPVLKTIIDEASEFTSKPDRIVLLDQLIGLANLAQVSTSVKVGSQEFLAKLGDQNDSSLQQSKRMRDKWQSICDRLLTTDPQSSLGQQLRYFASDGGIGKLQELIFNHVAAHSLKQLCDETTSAAKKLHKQQNDLKPILSNLGISLEESPALSELRSSIGEMKSTYNSFKNDLGKEPLKDARGVAINDVIKDEVTYRILNWKQWNLLFGQAQNGIIVLPLPATEEDNPFAREMKAIDNIPIKSDDFYNVFEQTVNQLQKFARDCIEESIVNLLNNLSKKLSKQIQYLQGILIEERKTEIEEKIGQEESGIFSVVSRTYNPEKWQTFIKKQTFKEEKSIETKTIFPLACKDEKHESGQIFDWALEYKKINTQTSNQVLLVQRLRDEIAASISLHIIEYVSQINKKADLTILDSLNRLTRELDLLLRNEKLLRYIAGEKPEINETDSVSPVLSKIALISPPETSSLGKG